VEIILEPIKISASKISIAEECFGKYYYRYIEKPNIKNVCWPGTIQGIVNHLLLEQALNLRKKGAPIDIIIFQTLERFESEIQKEFDLRKQTDILKYPRNYNYEEFIKHGKEIISEYIRYVLNLIPRGFQFETEFNIEELIPDLGVILEGYIDLIYWDNNDNIHIVDYKNTSDISKWRNFNWENDIQSRIYIFMVYKKYGYLPRTFSYLVIDKKWIKVSKFEYIIREDFIQNNGFRYIEKKIKDLVRNTLFHNTSLFTPSEELCKWCDYRTICPRSYYV
jgi:hypothetical protein